MIKGIIEENRNPLARFTPWVLFLILLILFMAFDHATISGDGMCMYVMADSILLGLIVGLLRYGRQSIVFLACVLAQLCINSIIWDWWAGYSFGNRRLFVQITNPPYIAETVSLKKVSRFQ